MMLALAFLAGLVVGAAGGVVVMCLLFVASAADGSEGEVAVRKGMRR